MNWPDRFWSKAQKSEGCWLWAASVNRKGYGYIGVPGGQVKLAHRVSWQLTHGTLAPSDCILHRCDTPACVRPEHLFLGSRADNNRDMAQKGRAFRGAARSAMQRITSPRGASHWTQQEGANIPAGERNGHAKLTAGDVRSILALQDSRTSDEIAAQFGVSRTAINHIFAGRTWRQIARERLAAESQGLSLSAARAGQLSLLGGAK